MRLFLSKVKILHPTLRAHCVFHSVMLTSLEFPQDARGQGRSGPNDVEIGGSMNIHLDKLGKNRALSKAMVKSINSGVRLCQREFLLHHL